MTDLNHVVLIGRLTRDLSDDERSFGFMANGTARANISIAVNRSKKVNDQWQDETYYFDVTIWGKTAENLKPYLTKGQQISVDGYLKQDRWEKDGQKMSKISIVANAVQLLGGKKDSSNIQQNNYQHSDNVQQNNYQNTFSNDNFTGSEGFSEDIPFSGDPDSIPF